MKSMLIVDLETTGLDPARHAIIEVSALLVDPTTFEVKQSFHTYVQPRPDSEVDPRAMDVNKIDLDKIRGESFLTGEMLEQLAKMSDGAQLVGHGISFDKSFLDWNYAYYDRSWKLGTYRLVDTQSMARALEHKGLIQSCSLESVCNYFGVSNDGAHSATADTLRTLEVYKRLVA